MVRWTNEWTDENVDIKEQDSKEVTAPIIHSKQRDNVEVVEATEPIEHPKVIPIDNIQAMRNIRTDIGDVSELMNDIRENGLMHPMGIWKDKTDKTQDNEDIYYIVYGHRRFEALKKLGRKTLVVDKEVRILDSNLAIQDVIIMNISENIHRLDNTPAELGKACSDLRKMGLSIGEISSRLNITKPKIITALRILAKAPEEIKESIGYIHGRENKKGKISASAADVILRLRVKQKDINELFDYAKKEELGAKEVNLIGKMMGSGNSLKESLKLKEQYVVKSIDLVCNKEELEKLEKEGTGILAYTRAALKGELQHLNKDLIF